MGGRKLIEISGILVLDTDKAILFDDGSDDKPKWIPKSQINNLEDVEDTGNGDALIIVIPEWIAEQRGFI